MNNPDITLYGIPNCDTVKKSRAWLAARGCSYHFHDFKQQGAPADLLARWMTQAGWETLLNRKGTTWRRLDATTQAGIHDAASASALMGALRRTAQAAITAPTAALSASPLMQAQPSIIKRPVVEWRSGSAVHVTVGFNETAWQECLKSHPSVG